MFKKVDVPNTEEKVIDIETGIQGSIKFDGPIKLRISGNFEGELETKGTLIIGENANVKASIIRGENIKIEGRVRGDIVCGRLELASSAKVVGSIEVSALVVSEGAILKGKCQMPFGDEKSDDREAPKKRSEKKQQEETASLAAK